MVLILAPTRELAKQVADEFESVEVKLAVQTVYGGGGGASIQRQVCKMNCCLM